MITISRPDILSDADFQALLAIVEQHAAPIAIYTPGVGLTRICWCARNKGNYYTVRPPREPNGIRAVALTLELFDRLVAGD